MSLPMVAIPQAPHLLEFEAVLDHATQSDAMFRRAFIEHFFDFMLGRRMNCKADGLVHVVMAQVVERFAALYMATVDVSTDKGWPDGFYLVGVGDWLKHYKLSLDTHELLNEALAKRLTNIQMKNPQLMFNEMFVVDNNETPNVTANIWLDHMALLSKFGEGKPYISTIRKLTILARSYELLVAHIGKNDWE